MGVPEKGKALSTFYPFQGDFVSCYHREPLFRTAFFYRSLLYYAYCYVKLILGLSSQHQSSLVYTPLEALSSLALSDKIKLVWLSIPVALSYERGSMGNRAQRCLVRLGQICRENIQKDMVIEASNDIVFWDRLLLWSLQGSEVELRGYFHGFPSAHGGIANTLFNYMLVPSASFAELAGVKEYKIKSDTSAHRAEITLDSHPRIVVCTFPDPIRLMKGVSFRKSPPMPAPIEYLRRIVENLEIKVLCLRIHPSEHRSFYRGVAKKFGVRIVFTSEIKQGDVFLGPVSTFFFDAVNRGNAYYIYDPVESGTRLNGSIPHRGLEKTILQKYILQQPAEIASRIPKIREDFSAESIREISSFYATV